ncbi:MAG: hypothetical protein JOZ08_19820 [Verrucomicrobia bacterium]|nr:hypothetical protein [Verrucomicrobiota bacterium]
MSILGKIKEQISSASQRALGIDGIRYQLQATLEKLDKLYQIEGRLVELEARSAQIDGRTALTNDQLQNLQSFLTWYSNRVEPWFWTGNFSHNDPEEELAGLLFNFLPGNGLLNVGPKTSAFAKAAARVGYEVHHLEPPDAIASPEGLKTSGDKIDFLNISGEDVDAGLVKALDSIRAAVVQIEFADDNSLPANNGVQQKVRVPTSEIIKELRGQSYYWSVIIFRTEAEGFIRMGTNLASIPDKAWGTIVFFRDHQLFLKAFHWCKTTLPRYRAARLAT